MANSPWPAVAAGARRSSAAPATCAHGAGVGGQPQSMLAAGVAPCSAAPRQVAARRVQPGLDLRDAGAGAARAAGAASATGPAVCRPAPGPGCGRPTARRRHGRRRRTPTPAPGGSARLAWRSPPVAASSPGGPARPAAAGAARPGPLKVMWPASRWKLAACQVAAAAPVGEALGRQAGRVEAAAAGRSPVPGRRGGRRASAGSGRRSARAAWPRRPPRGRQRIAQPRRRAACGWRKRAAARQRRRRGPRRPRRRAGRPAGRSRARRSPPARPVPKSLRRRPVAAAGGALQWPPRTVPPMALRLPVRRSPSRQTRAADAQRQQRQRPRRAAGGHARRGGGRCTPAQPVDQPAMRRHHGQHQQRRRAPRPGSRGREEVADCASHNTATPTWRRAAPMKLATYKDGSRDGQLVVVSRDLAWPIRHRHRHPAATGAGRLELPLAAAAGPVRHAQPRPCATRLHLRAAPVHGAAAARLPMGRRVGLSEPRRTAAPARAASSAGQSSTRSR